MAKNWLFWGRVLYSIPLSITGVIYLWKPQGTVESLTSFIPGGLELIYVAGSLWFILGFMIVSNVKTLWALWGVIGLLCIYFVMVHIPAIYTGEYLNIVWFEFLRDISLLGGAFLLMANQIQEQEEETIDKIAAAQETIH
jgi:uncharacterized membrane protein YphA (DoxX/SURF4 family)